MSWTFGMETHYQMEPNFAQDRLESNLAGGKILWVALNQKQTRAQLEFNRVQPDLNQSSARAQPELSQSSRELQGAPGSSRKLPGVQLEFN